MRVTKNISELPGPPGPVIMDADLSRAHAFFEGLVAQYGHMFTVQFAGQPMVVVAGTKLLNFILCKRPELFGPYCRNSRILEAIKADGIETADGPDWKRQREIIAASMESGYLARYFGHIKAVTEGLKDRWLSYGENLPQTDWAAEIYSFSISVFTAVMFGERAARQTGEPEGAPDLLLDLVAVLGARIDALLPQMHLPSFSEDKGFEEKITEIVRVTKNLVSHNRALLAGNKGAGQVDNLLQVLITTMEEAGLVSHDVKLTENILQILLASEPTTAETLLRVLHCLAAQPHVQHEIQDEVDALLGKRAFIEDIKDIKKLKCIDAVILETMRIASVSRLVLVAAKTDLSLEDVAIAKGTPLILLVAYGGLDEANFYQAQAFDCQRWRSENRMAFEPHNSKAALGFGAGPRSCPGRGLAMLVMKTVLAMICKNFQIRPVPETPATDETVANGRPGLLGFTLEAREASPQ
jgi:cytochrome P450